MHRTRDVDAAKDRILESITTARQVVGPKLRDDVAPAVAAALDTAREATAPARAEALNRAGEAVAALRGRPRVPRWQLMVAAIGGVGAGVAVGIAVSRAQQPAHPMPAAPERIPTAP